MYNKYKMKIISVFIIILLQFCMFHASRIFGNYKSQDTADL